MNRLTVLPRARSAAAVLAAVAALLATPEAPADATANAIPKGHYLSLDRSRDLRSEMLEPIRAPEQARSEYHLGFAQRLHEALQTPGLRGLWMQFAWRDVEVADGEYDWRLIDRNLEVLSELGLRLIIKIADRSFRGHNFLPEYFPPEYVLASRGGGNHGYTAKRWDPYVYERQIRLYRAIAERYADHPAFAGIATTESAPGSFDGGDYSLDKYVHALAEIIEGTLPALERGKLFFYLNFLPGGNKRDLARDARIRLLQRVPHENLVVGAPDITPDVSGMPPSATAYRIHARRTLPELEQFCHLQHRDQGLRGINVKNNAHRKAYARDIEAARKREQASWFDGAPAVFEPDDLANGIGGPVELHPESEVGQLWSLEELLDFGHRNFDCQYVMWHYRDAPSEGEFGWPDVKAVIEANPCFYDPAGCAGAKRPPR